MSTSYNFQDSLSRIDSILSSILPDKAGSIKSAEEKSSSSLYMPQATIVHVKYEIEPSIWHPSEEYTDLPVLQSFVSEAISICGASTCCKDIMVADKYLRAVYDTPLKTQLNEALDDAARIRALAMVISKKSKQYNYPMIKVSVGMDYGVVSMLPINNQDNRFLRYLWMGETVKNAEQNANKADDDVVISEIVWKNLTENNRKLFEFDDLSSMAYRGKIVNIVMNNWIAK